MYQSNIAEKRCLRCHLGESEVTFLQAGHRVCVSCSNSRIERDRRRSVAKYWALAPEAREAKNKTHAARYAEYKREWTEINRVKLTETRRKQYLLIKADPEYKRRTREYMIGRFRTDPVYRVKSLCRHRVLEALKKAETSTRSRTHELLGATPKFVLGYLTGGATRFPEGYEIDHHIPIAYFDITRPEEQLVCFNWRNLRLLTKAENVRKSDSLPEDYRAVESEIRTSLSLDSATL